MPTLLLAFLLAQPGAAEQQAREQLRLELEFDGVWSTYLMKAVGCPTPEPGYAVAFTKEVCSRPPELDLRLRERARRLAMRVFGMEGR